MCFCHASKKVPRDEREHGVAFSTLDLIGYMNIIKQGVNYTPKQKITKRSNIDKNIMITSQYGAESETWLP